MGEGFAEVFVFEFGYKGEMMPRECTFIQAKERLSGWGKMEKQFERTGDRKGQKRIFHLKREKKKTQTV